jgi:hypothetical protein
VNKKCVVNVRNEDTRCLLYALASALHADVICGHRERPTLYAPFLDELKRDGVRFPASVDDAAAISEMNALPLHVFGLDISDPENRDFTFEHHNRVFTSRPPIALLRLHEGSRVGHFVWIRRFNAFVRFSRASLHCCAVCLQRFKRETALHNHVRKGACISAGEKVKVLPTLEKSTVRFAGFARQLRAPFVVYADLECLLLPASEARGPQTTATQTHAPCCVGAYLVSRYPDIMASQYVFWCRRQHRAILRMALCYRSHRNRRHHELCSAELVRRGCRARGDADGLPHLYQGVGRRPRSGPRSSERRLPRRRAQGVQSQLRLSPLQAARLFPQPRGL